jgi:hypothetical protein
VKKLRFWLAMFLLVVSGVAGINNAMREFGEGATMLQRSVGYGVALYAVLGLIGAAGLRRRRPWVVTVAAAWGVTITYVASVASFAFHDPRFEQQGTLAGVLGSFIACSLMGWLVVSTAIRETHAPAQTPTRPVDGPYSSA